MTARNVSVVDDAVLDAAIAVDADEVDLAVHLYRAMVLIREFEQRVNRLFLQGRIPGTIHLSLGQEACAVGGCDPLRQDDWITITHRGHGQALAKGVSAASLMAELFAKDTGCCRGQGGSLHVGDINVGAIPGIAIVGAAVPIAAGVGFGFQARGEDRVALSFLGDGAMGEGDTHEGLNLAALWQVPVVYLCENNRYSISTPLDRQFRIASFADFVAGYGMETCTVDGNDVLAVRAAVDTAVQRARQGGGPTFIEALTYRQGGHKRDDPASYRPKDEVDRWLARDPIARLRAGLEHAGRSDAVEAAQRDASETIDDAVAFADASPDAVLEPT